ncbi:hypothetical protein BGZ49_004280 [Haplosporangium sp. Z 27]|nr:hypothetical protein BGZ49_004280 [Haplosporangium sp. Z 27]
MSAPTENSLKFTTNTSGIDSQSLLNLQMTEEPDSMVVDNSSAEFQQGMSPVGLFGEQASTFGLSDDDLMSSFTTFTAKLGDSILAKSPLYAPKHGGILDNGNHTMDHDHLKQSIPSLSPPSKELSPTTSNGSPSNSPWMSWTTEGQRFNVQQSFGAPRPGMAVDMQQVYTGIQPSFTTSPQQNSINLQTGYPQNLFAQRGGAEVPEDKQYQPYQHHQVDTWNQYMQYLLHQQELGLQLPDQNVSQPLGQYSQQIQVAPQIYQQPLDPHWQATMMTMMMNQNSGVSSIGESDRGLLANNANNMVLPPGLNYHGQQPPL